MNNPIRNTQQRVTDAYRDNPLWDKDGELATDKPDKSQPVTKCLCGAELVDGHCKLLLGQQGMEDNT